MEELENENIKYYIRVTLLTCLNTLTFFYLIAWILNAGQYEYVQLTNPFIVLDFKVIGDIINLFMVILATHFLRLEIKEVFKDE